ncbi:hypothetical protein DK842_21470 [Chromobacterium phragmitis]|uniref:hypothetical protein n=1 Tax=Chromobacterium phragmitis TaxID=2202141 RepID=UPI000DED1541|nr:hypothetical protein [Chromobacterium phragmitis]AXE32252.1 hypothetical protein DK842_21470 [Chromobacterium phragmitis]
MKEHEHISLRSESSRLALPISRRYATEASALQGTKATWEKIQRGVAEFSIQLATGRPELFPELPAKVSSFKPIIDACDWIGSEVTRRVRDGGYTTALEMEVRLEDVPG